MAGVQLGKYDFQKAMIEYSEYQASVLLSFSEYSNQIAQNNIVEKLLQKVKQLGLTGVQYERENIVQKIINYCVAKRYMPKNKDQIIPLITRRSRVQTNFNRLTQNTLTKPTITQSAATVKLTMYQNKVDINQMNHEENPGLHICINPTSALQEGNVASKKELQESISNSLEAYFKQRKQDRKLGKAGRFRQIEKEEKLKYEQIVAFFEEGNSLSCLSFDFFFDGKKFREECKEKNPFNNGSIHYLDLSFQYAQVTNDFHATLGNFQNPHYNLKKKTHIQINQIKSDNLKIMKWKAYKNLDIFLNLISQSANIRHLKMINLSGLTLTHSIITQLGNILMNGDVEYLDLGGCSILKNESFSRADGIQLLKDALSRSNSLQCVILDDLTYCEKITKKKCCSQQKMFVYRRLSDTDFSSLIFELDYMKTNLNEIYLNWNKEQHKNKKFLIDKKINEEGSDQHEMEKIIRNENQGSLGVESYKILFAIVLNKPFQVYEMKNNQFPFDKVQNFAIALLSNSTILNLSVSGNTDYDLLHEAHSCFTCCFGIFSCFSCLSCCFKVEDYSRRSIKIEVEKEILNQCNNNRDKPVRQKLYLEERKKYDAFKAELDIKEENDRKQRIKEQQDREKAAQAKKEEEERLKNLQIENQIKIAAAGASKTLTNVQVKHDGSIAHFGDTVKTQNSIKQLDTVPLQISQKNQMKQLISQMIEETEEDVSKSKLKKSKISKNRDNNSSSEEDDNSDSESERKKKKKMKLSKKKSKMSSKKQRDEEQLSSSEEEDVEEKPKKEKKNSKSQIQDSKLQGSKVQQEQIQQQEKENQNENIKNQESSSQKKQDQQEVVQPNQQKQQENQQKTIDDVERAKLLEESNILVKKKGEQEQEVDQVIILE